MDVHYLTGRIRAEFLEMPGLRLTVRQASRLWGLEHTVCESVIDKLVASDFLRRTAAGLVVRNEP
jgi:hypothetical protein